MLRITMDIENSKSDIINWIVKINSKTLISKLEQFRLQESFIDELTEEQKASIIRSINELEEDN